MLRVTAAVRPMELWLSLLIIAVLGKSTYDGFRQNFGRDSKAAPPHTRATPSTKSNPPGFALPESRTRTRFEALQRERSWAMHRINAARATEIMDQSKARLSSRNMRTEGEKRVWRLFFLEQERELRRGPETDEERAFDAAARSVDEIDRDLQALPATKLIVEEIEPPATAAPDESAVVRIRVLCKQDRPEQGYTLVPRIPDPSPYGTRYDSISRASHACLASSIELRERQYYDSIMRGDREYTHYAWTIRASQALHDALVTAILGEKSVAFLDVPTSLPTDLAGRKLPDLRDMPVQPPVGIEALRFCILHFRPDLGRDGYGPITKSLRLTEIPPP